MQPMTVKEIAAAVSGIWWNPREDAPMERNLTDIILSTRRWMPARPGAFAPGCP